MYYYGTLLVVLIVQALDVQWLLHIYTCMCNIGTCLYSTGACMYSAGACMYSVGTCMYSTGGECSLSHIHSLTLFLCPPGSPHQDPPEADRGQAHKYCQLYVFLA